MFFYMAAASPSDAASALAQYREIFSSVRSGGDRVANHGNRRLRDRLRGFLGAVLNRIGVINPQLRKSGG